MHINEYLINKSGMDVNIKYYAEEPNTGEYIASDKDMTEQCEYVFDSWEDGSKANPRLVTPSQGSKYTAKFK